MKTKADKVAKAFGDMRQAAYKAEMLWAQGNRGPRFQEANGRLHEIRGKLVYVVGEAAATDIMLRAEHAGKQLAKQQLGGE